MLRYQSLSGEATVASCVVFGPEGPLKSDYRRYNIEGVTAGDDYAAMHQALTRRFSRLKDGEGKMPDILLVDGGKGQLAMAQEVLQELAVAGLILLGVAKGVTRKPGLETLYLNDASHEFTLPADSPALHLIQQIRDEAHRFAITGHRARRGEHGGRRRWRTSLASARNVGATCSSISAGCRNCRGRVSMNWPKPPVSVKSLPSRFMPSCTASRMPAHLAA